MSKYCFLCGKVKTWENPFIEGEPVLCDSCSSKLQREINESRKMINGVLFVRWDRKDTLNKGR